MDAVAAYELSKQYGNSIALCGLNLQVREGEAFACVGGEKSGKTTVIRLLSGLCRPTMGECTVLGLSPYFETEKLHAAVGTVLDTARLYESLTLSENLRFFAGINGVEENDAIDRCSFLLHKLDIWEGRDEKVDALPTDVVRRGTLARALMHSPRLLLLDEPAEDLDRESAEAVRSLLDSLREQEGVTVFLCSENMDFAQNTCENFAFLKEGALLAKGDLDSLRRGAGVRFRAALRLADDSPPPKGFQLRDGFWQREIDSEEELPGIISRMTAEGKRLYEARTLRPTLEEIYAACLTGGIRRAGEADEQDDQYEDETDSPEAGLPGAGFREPDLPEAGPRTANRSENFPGADPWGDGSLPEPEDGSGNES